jgi:hypothetical protein
MFLAAAGVFCFAVTGVFVQQATVEERVAALESYVSTIQPTLVDLSNGFNQSIQKYTEGLETSLADYSQKLQANIDQRMERAGRKGVVLNPFSSTYQSIETNTGVFLIAIERMEQIENGVRLHVNVGNPNYADYNDFTLRFIWGKKRVGEMGPTYEEWRQTLKGVDVTFNGKLARGKWNSMEVDLTPVGEGELSYLECEMNVSSVELEMDAAAGAY